MEDVLVKSRTLAAPYIGMTGEPHVRLDTFNHLYTPEEARRLALHLLEASAVAETELIDLGL